MPTNNTDSQQPERFLFLDALRGLSALGVIICHVWLSLRLSLLNQIPEYIDIALRAFAYCVMPFFVLSGFVIAYSLRNAFVNLQYVGSFALRRSVRLDPPYWIMIALQLLRIFLAQWVFPQTNLTYPPLPELPPQSFFFERCFCILIASMSSYLPTPISFLGKVVDSNGDKEPLYIYKKSAQQ